MPSKPFLSEERRHQLIAELTALSMPRQRAEDMASVQNHVDLVDICLSHAVEWLGINCNNLTQASLQRDDHGIQKWRLFIRADLLILDAYLGEINERELPKSLFPKAARTTLATNLVLDDCKSRLP
jgi:hypothetical protein